MFLTNTCSYINTCISFPKSGRTWLRVMLDELGVEVRYTHAGSAHIEALHWSELETSLATTIDRGVVLHRDPRDVAVSGYYQTDRRLGGYEGNISEFLRDPHHGIEKIVRFKQMWLDLVSRVPNMTAVSYEQLSADPQGTLSIVTRFLGHTFNGDRIAKVVEANTFAKMQERERTGFYEDRYGSVLTPGDVADETSFKVRRGIVGGYRDELSPDDIRYCTDIMDGLSI